MKAWKLSPIFLAVLSANSFATDATGVALGSGFTLLPSVDLNVESNDNIYSQAKNETADIITRLKPAAALQADLGKTLIDVYYQAEQGVYGDDKNDDYLDQKLNAGLGYEFNSHHKVDLNASYSDSHDARGQGTIEGPAGTIIDPDEYEEAKAGFNYTYGAKSAFGNVDIYADTLQKRYSNNKLVTSAREHDKINYGAILSLTNSEASEFIFEARKTEISYEEDSMIADNREGAEQRLLAGMRWDISGATTGEIKVGRSARTFKESSVSSNNRLAWEANLTWQPLTYSTVIVSSSQNSNETNGAGDYIANTFTSVNWEHEFSTFYSAGINTSLNSDVYVADPAGREDDMVTLGINGTYSPLPWMDVNASYNYSDRDSNNSTFEYSSNVIKLGLVLAL